MKISRCFDVWRYSNILAVVAVWVLTVLCCHEAAADVAVPVLPESELAWKNVTVGGKKTAVFTIVRDSRGIMWAGTNNGLYFYDGVTVHPVVPGELAGTQIYSIVEYGGSLLLGTNHGLVVYDRGSGEVNWDSYKLPNEIRKMLLIDGHLWVGSLFGIHRLNPDDGKVTDMSAGLPHKSVYSLLRDSRGVLYAGTFNGLARWNTHTKCFEKVRGLNDSGDRNLFVNSLLESPDESGIYIGSEGSLYEYLPVSDTWHKISEVEGNTIKSLANGQDGHLLVGTDNGVYDLYRGGVRHYRHDSRYDLSLSDNEIWCVMADADHNIWAGHERGFSIASNSSTIRTVKLGALARSGEGNEIHTIYRDSGKALWLGGTNGIIRLGDSGMPAWYRHSKEAKSLSHNRIRAIDEDGRHNIWLSTDGGLNRYDPARGGFDVFNVVDEKGEHNSNWVYAFEEWYDKYWVGGFLSGLHCVSADKMTGGGGTVVADYSLNTETDRLRRKPLHLSNDLVNNMLIDPEGNMWILLFRDNTLIKYHPGTSKIKKYDIYEMTGGYPSHICLDSHGQLWCAYNGGVVLFDRYGRDATIKFPNTNSDEGILAMARVGDGIWLSTQSNMWKVDSERRTPRLLPIPQKSYTAIYEDAATGKVLLGGTDEIVEVDYRKIDDTGDYRAIRLVLFDKGDGTLDLSDPQSGINGVTIPYGGNITMVVSTLDYSPESPQRFMYKVAESKADTTDGWIVMPEGTNTITLSDLKMGSHVILVKAVGTTVSPTAIPLKVENPPALSWWAILLYILAVLGVILLVIRYLHRRSLRTFREQERQTALENVEKKLSFLSTMSHDLKTPLSMIMGPASVMKEKARDPESKRNLESIYDNAVRLNNMIHRTLELQRLEDADESLLIMSTFDVVEFCKGVFEVFRENNVHKKFVFHSASPRLFIEADAVKLESVMTNLLSNACKYSDDGATISCGISKTGDKVEITVSDDGVGISDAEQPLVFQRMFRSPSTAKLREGTGLGLYLIKKYLELMNGNITLYSKEGQGTSFVVTLPATVQTLPSRSPGNDADDSGKAKILIVEDNMEISDFIAGFLSDEYTCFTAENGRSGLSIASSVIPDLIIVDEMMPIMSGMEMIRRIKQNPRLVSVPVIMLTAKNDSRTENESIMLGVDVFMGKPFEPSALLSRIRHLLKGRSEIKEKVRIQAIAEAETRPITAESVNEKALAKIAKVIEDNIADPELNVNLLCEKTGIPNKQLYRLIKKYLGIGPLDYIRRVRLQKAAVLLGQRRFTVSEISYMVGFKTPSYFAKCFQNHYGVKPSQYQNEDEIKDYKTNKENNNTAEGTENRQS